jgi:hypothetical protein
MEILIVPNALRSGRSLLLSSFAIVAALPAWAAGEDTPGRYTMSPAEGGIIRLDRETGAMSFCTGAEGNWSCKDMAETESALKQRVEQLEAEKRAHDAEKELRGAPQPGPSAAAPDAAAPLPGEAAPPPPPGDLPIPNERDVDKLFDYVEGMVKKFKERIDRLEREAKKEPGIPL